MGGILTLMHLPAQSGKTRKMTDLINKWNTKITESETTGDVNIIFTSNTKLLAKQCSTRVARDCSESYVDLDDSSSDNISDISSISTMSDISDNLGLEKDHQDTNIMRNSKTFVWIHERGHDLDPRELAECIRNGTYVNIICCSNSKRMAKAVELIKMLNEYHGEYLFNKRAVEDYEKGVQMPFYLYERFKKSLKSMFNMRLNIWIDEADASMRFWKKYIPQFSGNEYKELIHNIELISATLSPVYKELVDRNLQANIRVYNKTHSDVYLKYKDCDIRHEYGNKASMLQHIENVLDNESFASDSRLYCPGSIKRSSHEQISQLLQERGFNVLIVNAIHKEIRFEVNGINYGSIPLDRFMNKSTELSQVLNDIYVSNGFNTTPFAVTGNLCIGRGITFAGDQFMFTHGIIPEMKNPDEAYQSVARCIGNIIGKDNYQKPIIFIGEKTHIKILDNEMQAITTAQASNYGENLMDASTVEITGEGLKSFCRKDSPKRQRVQFDREDRAKEVFDTQEEAIRFVKNTLNKKMNRRTENIAPRELLINGENPSVDAIFNRMWGINNNSPVRMVPTNDNKWCVYWRPSLLSTSASSSTSVST